MMCYIDPEIINSIFLLYYLNCNTDLISTILEILPNTLHTVYTLYINIKTYCEMILIHAHKRCVLKTLEFVNFRLEKDNSYQLNILLGS